MPQLKLSLKDRVILANQYRILEMLDKESAEQYARNREIVESGYQRAYAWLVEQFSPDGLSDEECGEVYDILDMHRRLGFEYVKLSDKNGIDASELRFIGFDGNNESSYLAFHQFLAQQKKWVEVPPENSHSPTLDMYRRMLEVFRTVQKKRSWDKAEIQKIVAARVHPDHRDGQ